MYPNLDENISSGNRVSESSLPTMSKNHFYRTARTNVCTYVCMYVCVHVDQHVGTFICTLPTLLGAETLLGDILGTQDFFAQMHAFWHDMHF
jgi:hypothetical protein